MYYCIVYNEGCSMFIRFIRLSALLVQASGALVFLCVFSGLERCKVELCIYGPLSADDYSSLGCQTFIGQCLGVVLLMVLLVLATLQTLIWARRPPTKTILCIHA